MIEVILTSKNKITIKKSFIVAIEEEKWFDEEQKGFIKVTRIRLPATSFLSRDNYEDLKKKIFRSKEYV